MQHPEEAKDEIWIFDGQEKVPPTVRVRIAENVTKIPDDAFDSHQELEEVILFSSVLVIGERAFRWCWKLKSILYQGLEKEAGIPPTVKDWNELVKTLSVSALFKRLHPKKQNLTEVHIPSTVKVIDSFAFFGCKLVKRLGFNEGLERIGEYAFDECPSLSHVRSPQSVNSIATNAFSFCSDLISIELPEESSIFPDSYPW
eukprot:scaffold6322_cov59-Cylindrotheca_fusiformis.AAC.14